MAAQKWKPQPPWATPRLTHPGEAADGEDNVMVALSACGQDTHAGESWSARGGGSRRLQSTYHASTPARRPPGRCHTNKARLGPPGPTARGTGPGTWARGGLWRSAPGAPVPPAPHPRWATAAAAAAVSPCLTRTAARLAWRACRCPHAAVEGVTASPTTRPGLSHAHSWRSANERRQQTGYSCADGHGAQRPREGRTTNV